MNRKAELHSGTRSWCLKRVQHVGLPNLQPNVAAWRQWQSQDALSDVIEIDLDGGLFGLTLILSRIRLRSGLVFLLVHPLTVLLFVGALLFVTFRRQRRGLVLRQYHQINAACHGPSKALDI